MGALAGIPRARWPTTMAFVSLSPTTAWDQVFLRVPPGQGGSDGRHVSPVPRRPTTTANAQSAATEAVTDNKTKMSVGGGGGGVKGRVGMVRDGRGVGGASGSGPLHRKNRVRGTDNPHSRLFVKKVRCVLGHDT